MQENNQNITNFFEKTDTINIYQSTPDKHVYILILTSTQNSWEKVSKEIKDNIPQRYNEKLEDWQPYEENKITHLLEEFERKSKQKITKYYLSNELITTEIKGNIKKNKEHIILIVDAFSLHFEEVNEVAKMFDETSGNVIKACLIPNCSDYTENQHIFAQQKINGTFEYLTRELENCFDTNYMHIELNISNKKDFFRRLANIMIGRGLSEKIIILANLQPTKRYENPTQSANEIF